MSNLLEKLLSVLAKEDAIDRETADLLLEVSRMDLDSRMDALTLEEIRLVSQLRHIPAIKSIRSRMDISLKDSKYLADECRVAMGVYHDDQIQYEKERLIGSGQIENQVLSTKRRIQ